MQSQPMSAYAWICGAQKAPEFNNNNNNNNQHQTKLKQTKIQNKIKNKQTKPKPKQNKKINPNQTRIHHVLWVF